MFHMSRAIYDKAVELGILQHRLVISRGDEAHVGNILAFLALFTDICF